LLKNRKVLLLCGIILEILIKCGSLFEENTLAVADASTPFRGWVLLCRIFFKKLIVREVKIKGLK